MMEAQEFMEQYLIAEASLRRKLEELEKLRSLAENVALGLRKENESFSKTMKNVAKLENDVAGEVEKLKTSKMNVKKAIASLDDDRYVALLEYRYIIGLTFEETAERMIYSVRNIYVLHKQAVHALNGKMRNEENHSMVFHA